MIYKENEEKCAVKIITDYLKEEKNIQIKKARHLTLEEGQPPDYYFEIGDRKIGCEVTHFDLKEKDNLAKETDRIDKIVKRVQRDLHKKGIPPLCWRMGFTTSPTEVRKNAENIVNAITMMHNESITDSEEYKRNDCDIYYDLFLGNNIDYIAITYIDPLEGANIDEKYLYGGGNRSRFPKTIKVEEMQAVITCKDKDIPNYKDIPNCKERYDQNWLIITNYEFIDFFILKDAAEEAQYKCNFDNVLYIEWRGIEPKPRKQKRTGTLTDEFAVYELNGARRS